MIYKIQNITKKYEVSETETLTVFENLSIELSDSKIYSIVGASGVGKSTLLHIVGTIDKPNSGDLHFYENDKNLDLINTKEKELNKFRNKNLGFIFQFHHLLPEFTALENVFIPAMIANANKKDYQKRAGELLDFVGISNRADHKPKKMSGGEQQRVAIARALINNPKLLIADEPTGNLDERNSDIISELFIKVNKEIGTSVLSATHSSNFASIADYKYEMKQNGLFAIN